MNDICIYKQIPRQDVVLEKLELFIWQCLHIHTCSNRDMYHIEEPLFYLSFITLIFVRVLIKSDINMVLKELFVNLVVTSDFFASFKWDIIVII